MIQDANGESVVVVSVQQPRAEHREPARRASDSRPLSGSLAAARCLQRLFQMLAVARRRRQTPDFFSDSIMLDVTGNDDPEMLLGAIAPERELGNRPNSMCRVPNWRADPLGAGRLGEAERMAMFLIHPSDLEQRRKRCRAEADRLLSPAAETVVSCNVCSSQRHVLVSAKDRYGLPLRMRAVSGLRLVLSRRSLLRLRAIPIFMEAARIARSAAQFNGVTHTIDQVQADQVSYAKNLASAALGLRAALAGTGKLLDVGGSAGIVARRVRAENLACREPCSIPRPRKLPPRAPRDSTPS